MRLKWTLYFLLTLNSVSTYLCAQEDWMNEYDFVYLDTILEQAVYDVRYAGEYNFVGVKVNGYHSTRLVMTRKAALALGRAEQRLKELGYGLKIFDTYRPQRAVSHFVSWAKDRSDTLTKQMFYPHQDKRYLFGLGYISSRSGHTRGSTIDLTLYSLDDGTEVDMGGPYDYFGELSHHSYKGISIKQRKHRGLLKSIMSQCGFRPYSKEWWHYTLRNEPYPDKYFDFVVE